MATSPQSSGPASLASDPARARIESYLADHFDSLGLPANLDEAVRYALLGGGKRLRPILAWRSAVAVGGNGEESLPAGAAVELMHAFSLVHDDLPAMDDDDMRRGRPTLHVHAGEAMAILAGDIMQSLAYGVIERGLEANPVLIAKLVRELTDAATGMIAGQVYDTLGGMPGGLSDRDRLELVHRCKTGALIRAACRMGAMCSLGTDPDSEKLDAVTRYAEAVGLQFQVVDDLLDVEQSSEQIGKAAGKDAAAGKLTFPAVLGVEASRRVVEELHEAATLALRPLGRAAEGLREIAELMSRRTS